MNQDVRFPLTWPQGQPRTPRPKISRARFGKTTIASQTSLLSDELTRLGAGRDWILSSNLRVKQDGLPYSVQRSVIEDAGVAVYFMLFNRQHCLACDSWNRVEHNIRAIVLHIEALRGQERWGVGTLEQAFSGYAALPDPDSRAQRPWREVLEFEEDDECIDEHILRDVYRMLAKTHHPDAPNGDAVRFKEIAAAYKQAKAELQIH